MPANDGAITGQHAHTRTRAYERPPAPLPPATGDTPLRRTARHRPHGVRGRTWMCSNLIRKFSERVLQQVLELLFVEFRHVCRRGSRHARLELLKGTPREAHHTRAPHPLSLRCIGAARSLACRLRAIAAARVRAVPGANPTVGPRGGPAGCRRSAPNAQALPPTAAGLAPAPCSPVVRELLALVCASLGEWLGSARAHTSMLGEESAAIAPADRQFLHECLKVRREREGYLPTPPRSPACSVLPTPPASLRGEDALPRPRFGGPPVRLELHHLSENSSRTRVRHLSPGLHSDTGGEDALVLAVSELMRATAAVQAREREVVERVNKLELKMPSSSKVASEFQRMW